MYHLPAICHRFSISAVKDSVISFKIEKSLKAKLSAMAKAESRSLSNYIEKILREEISRRESKPVRSKGE